MMSLFRFFPFILVLLCITLAGSAPVSERHHSLRTIEQRNEDVSHLTEWSLRELPDLDTDDLFARDFPPPQHLTLVRRKSIFTKIKNAFKKVGSKIKDGFKKAGQGIKKAAQKVGQGVKKAAQKVGSGVKTAAKKVGKFVKTTGAKIAKFGLQIYSTAQSLAAKAAKFIPGVGKPISAALDGASKATGLAAKKIPVSLGKKLDKGMKVMDKIKNPVGGAVGAILRRDVNNEDMY